MLSANSATGPYTWYNLSQLSCCIPPHPPPEESGPAGSMHALGGGSLMPSLRMMPFGLHATARTWAGRCEVKLVEGQVVVEEMGGEVLNQASI